MKKLIFAFGMIFTLTMLIMCEDNETDNIPTDKKITFVKTELGGCHGQLSDDLKSTFSEQVDTVIFTIENDTLDAYIGLNYICCAPFTTDKNISNDSITFILNDTCLDINQPCYCKCMCYYTWNFLFVDFEEKEYNFKIILNDPREEQPIILKEGIVDLSKNMT
ncbi:MAG: hypothetical protein HQ521_02250 [Bacteroidetes bacterium]|nr:hypothetical protein [Bacteroidota bacterium]